MKHTFVIATILAALGASAAVEVTGVSAKQRWPWNNLVDVDFTLAGATGEKYVVNIDAQCAGGTKKFTATTFVTDPVVTPGANRVTWDFGKDYPGIRAEDMSFAVSVTPQSGSTQPLYLYIDLSAGSTATSYPVRYTNVGPAHTQGAQDEACQTTELWMRRIPAPTTGFMYSTSDGSFYARVTKDYYTSIFELTQKQYQLIAGSWPSVYFTNQTCRASRPVENVQLSSFTGKKPQKGEDSTVADRISTTSTLGKLRSRSGLAIELPTLAQWEWAGHGGTVTAKALYYVGSSYPTVSQVARGGQKNADRDVDTTQGTAAVGTYLPNNFGLYDMVGNVREIAREPMWKGTLKSIYQGYREDDTIGNTADHPLTDPLGVKEADAANLARTFSVGTCWENSLGTAYHSLWTHGNYYTDSDAECAGFRLVVEAE